MSIVARDQSQETTTQTAPPRTGGGVGTVRQLVINGALGLVGILLTVVVWWLLSHRMQRVQLPAPDVVWQAMWSNLGNMPALYYATYQTGGIADGLLYTTQNVVIGVAIGFVGGAATGLVIGRVKTAAALFQPLLVVLITVPVMVLLPFILAWFGTARIAQTGLVVFFTYVTITVVVANGLRNVPGSFEQSAFSLGASRSMVLWEVAVPATVPDVLGALRVCLAGAWSFEAIAEILGAQHGIGRIIRAMGVQSSTPELMAAAVWLVLAALVVDGVLVLGQTIFLTWNE